MKRNEGETRSNQIEISSLRHLSGHQLTCKLFPVLLTAWLIGQPCREEAADDSITKRRAESKGVNWRRGVAYQQGLAREKWTRSDDKWRNTRRGGKDAFAPGMVILLGNAAQIQDWKSGDENSWDISRSRFGFGSDRYDRFRTTAFERVVYREGE